MLIKSYGEKNTVQGELAYIFKDSWRSCINFKDLWSRTNRGSYMSAHVLLNLLNELGRRDKMRGLPSILSLFRNEFNKFNITRARMLDSIYHMTLRFL